MNPLPGQPPQPPFRPRSDAGLYASIAGFLFFALLGTVAFLAMVRPWERDEEPAPLSAPVDAGPPPVDAGPPAPEVVTYRASLSQSEQVRYGGLPYCNYAAVYTELEIEVVTEGTDANGRPVVNGGRAGGTFAEEHVGSCPHPTVPPNRQELTFASAAYEGDEIVIQYSLQSGAPPVTATFRGRFADGELDGTLTLRRVEAVHPLLVFVVEAPLILVRAPG